MFRSTNEKATGKAILGYPYTHSFRYSFRYSDYVQAGLVGAQDAGEPSWRMAMALDTTIIALLTVEKDGTHEGFGYRTL